MDRTSLPRPEIGRVRIRYKGSADWLLACVAYTWRPDDPEILRGQVIGSSGAKDYLINAVVATFAAAERYGDLQSISFLVLNGTPFAVYRRGLECNPLLTDATGRELEVERAS